MKVGQEGVRSSWGRSMGYDDGRRTGYTQLSKKSLYRRTLTQKDNDDNEGS